MNQSNVETNVVENETTEILAAGAGPTEDAIAELSSIQLALVGGGCGTVVFN